MVMKKIHLHDIPDELKALLSELNEDTQIVLMDGDQPIARLLSPDTKSSKRIFGLTKGAFVMSDDFDEDLPESFWLDEN